MGKQIYPLNSKRRRVLLDRWKKITWNIALKPAEVRSALIENQTKLQQDLTKERQLVSELESRVAQLEENVTLQEKQSSTISPSTSGQGKSQKRKARKNWDEYTPHHKRHKLEEIKNTATAALDENLEVVSLQMRTRSGGSTLIVKTNNDDCVTSVLESDKENTVKSILLVKDKYSISNAAYHELAMSERSLPRSCQIDKQVQKINQRWEVTNVTGFGKTLRMGSARDSRNARF